MSMHSDILHEAGGSPRRFPCRRVYSPQVEADRRRVAKLLHAAFVGAHSPHDGKRVAAQIGVPYVTFNAWCNGTRPFDWTTLPAILAATGDAQLVAGILRLGELGYTLSHDPAAEAPVDVRSHALSAGASTGALGVLVDEVVADGVVTHLEAGRVRAQADDAKRAIETTVRAVELRVAP